MENKLHQYKNVYSYMMEYSQEIVLFFDRKGKVVGCNKSAMDTLGYEDDIYELHISDIYHSVFKDINDQLIIYQKFQNHVAETVAYRKNQTCFPVKLKVVTELKDKRYYGVCMAVDISEMKRIRRHYDAIKNELELRNEAQNEFVANITHELKTPVNGIMGLTDTLIEGEEDLKKQETLRIIRKCCLSMNELINDLLDYAKIGNNKLVLEQRIFEFRQMIHNIAVLYQKQIMEKGLDFRISIDEEIPRMVIGDEHRLSQVIGNLLSNALKFTHQGQINLKIVKICNVEDKIELFIIVIDTGIGIKYQDMDKLFIPFSQVDSSITRRFGGTGLGLFVSKLLVEAMGGTISVNSMLNKGSTFSFTVQLGVPEQEQDDYLERDNLFYNIENGDYEGKSIDSNDHIKDRGRYTNGMIYPMTTHDSQNDLSISYEKLKLCIEMENWIKAEETLLSIKQRLGSERGNLRSPVMKLLFAIRSEDTDKVKECFADFDMQWMR